MQKKHLVLAVMTLALTVGGLLGSALAGSSYFEVDRDFYPYYPSLMKWNKSGVTFNEPKKCGGCHSKQYKEWNGSVHSLAFKDPVYQGELNKAVKAVGHEISRQCEGCHSPVGMMSGEIKGPGLAGLSEMALAGVSCDVCHSISGVTHWQTPSHEAENGSFILDPGVETKEGKTFVKRGPYKPSEYCGGGFHKCEESPLHKKSDICASCHQVYHYESHFPIEETFNEWKHGPFAQRDIHCQDCHMVDVDTFKRTADQFVKPKREEYRHYFSGANFLLTYLAAGAAKISGDEKLAKSLMNQYEMAVERLKSAAELELYPIYHDGKLDELKVRVKNIRAGHNLPTSLTNVRQMWLEITAKDETGKVVMTSGTLNPDGTLPDTARNFNSDGMGNDFHFAIDPWVVTAFSKHETIPPKGYREVYYGLHFPTDLKKITLEAKLRFRQADQKVAEALLGAVPKDIDLEKIYGLKSVPALPVVDMTSKELTIPTSK